MVSSTSGLSCFCSQLVMTCFVFDLLQQVNVSSMVSLFVGNSYDKVRYDRVIKSNQIRPYVSDLES